MIPTLHMSCNTPVDDGTAGLMSGLHCCCASSLLLMLYSFMRSATLNIHMYAGCTVGVIKEGHRERPQRQYSPDIRLLRVVLCGK